MKSLIIIWLTVLVVLVGGGLYMNHAINELVESLPEQHTSVLRGFNSLEVVNSDSTQLQPKNVHYECGTVRIKEQ